MMGCCITVALSACTGMSAHVPQKFQFMRSLERETKSCPYPSVLVGPVE